VCNYYQKCPFQGKDAAKIGISPEATKKNAGKI
jgi:hypothetical protein